MTPPQTGRSSAPFGLALALGLAVALANVPARGAPASYPTEALADYVFACMAVNGQTPDALRRCSCSIDRIAERVSYDDYVNASTVASMQAGAGDARLQMFRGSPWAREMLDKLRQAQAEAELTCF
jgi:hypothetical protein